MGNFGAREMDFQNVFKLCLLTKSGEKAYIMNEMQKSVSTTRNGIFILNSTGFVGE